IIDGVPIVGPFFNENLPLRDGVPLRVGLADGTGAVIQSPVINTVPGAIAIQEVLENREWAQISGEPLAYAPHLRKDPLAGVPATAVGHPVRQGSPEHPESDRDGAGACGGSGRSPHVLPPRSGVRRGSHVGQEPAPVPHPGRRQSWGEAYRARLSEPDRRVLR